MADSQLKVLETDVPLSQSLIWRLQRDFYIQRGLKAYTEDSIPSFITNNPFIAEIYARVVLSFLLDCRKQLGPNPLRILELGAGTGKLAFLLLRQLGELLPAQGLGLDSIRYCMSDCSESAIESWRSNIYLAEFANRGVLEFEVIEAGGELKSAFLNEKGPLVVIANYVFDTLPQDAYVIQNRRILEMLVSTTAPSSAEVGAPLSKLQLSYKNIPVAANRYPEESWNRILQLYESKLSTGTVSFPSAALGLLQKLGNTTAGTMLVLAADKGFAHEEPLALCRGTPALEFHTPDCFSQMVNFDAIGKYFQSVGGEALLPEKHSTNLSICAFIQRPRDQQFPATIAAYENLRTAFGPDDLFNLFAWLNAHMEEMNVAQILSALRLTRWDPIALLRFFPTLARQLRTVGPERYDLRDAVMRVWGNHFPVNQSENELAFDCGVILLELGFFEEAADMFKTSQRIFAPSAPTSYNLGLCYQGLGRSSDALASMVEACALDPKFEPARQARERLQSQAQHG